jgi:hypothetical protein
MEIFENNLQSFRPVSLSEMDGVALLDRMDTKYVFTTSQLPRFLEVLGSSYFVLEINGRRMFRYESLYFDTDDFLLYNHHYCGKLNRYKVRFRKYVESNLSYFEIKFKNNKGRTIKSRVLHETADSIEGKALELLQEKTPLLSERLNAKFWVNYSRITLVSHDFKERLTLDFGLEFRNAQNSHPVENLVIAELKQGKTGSSIFSRLMKQHHIRQGAISKYCFGVSSLFQSMRINNFKEQLHYLNRILYAAPAGS